MYDINVQKQKSWVALFVGAALLSTPALARKVRVTAYCLKCKDCDTRGVTRTNTRTKRGLAVSTNPKKRAYPLGTRLIIKGVELVVDDVGGGVAEGELDYRGARSTHEGNLAWGDPVLEVKRAPKKKKRRKR